MRAPSGPVYQHFDQQDRKHWPFFKPVEQLGLPLQLEDLPMDFPGMKMIVAHLGHPWETDLIALIRKCPNRYAGISAVHYRPWRYWQAMVTATE